ncbi:hypothetical protein MNBD_GAMMA11-2572 [hydrothermal vent metagenome]|uniref:Uncharacterized protein n=1 Tax=hydrothermal vent metagenome TaxID=652676 RepID=A0A3B0XVU5_9ZZZZ
MDRRTFIAPGHISGEKPHHSVILESGWCFAEFFRVSGKALLNEKIQNKRIPNTDSILYVEYILEKCKRVAQVVVVG